MSTNKIIGEKINLIPITEQDIPLIQKARNDPTTNFLLALTKSFFTIEETQQLVKKILTKKFSFCIEEKVSQEHIGIIYLKTYTEKNHHGELTFYLFDEKHRGKGYGYDALKTFCRHLFDQGGVNKITLKVLVKNTQAYQLYQSIGFKTIGTSRQDAYLNGNYEDKYLMELLKSEYI